MADKTFSSVCINKESDRFKKFLSLEDNQRIIFSGAFGTGKTYFLNKFFESNDHYEAIFLYPTHYVVSSNEDIFEYIKFDIAFQLLGKVTDYKEECFSNSFVFQFFLLHHMDDLFELLAKYTGKIGRPIKDAFDIFNLFEKFKKETKIDEKNDLYQYLSSQKNTKGSIFEADIITELLISLLDTLRYQNSENNKKIILVVDDLDRIDPDHIFRIMNIFAAHGDHYQPNHNKFQFDQIILVCDMENIRNIFHSRFGSNVDFSGYIDKFYSREVYQFNNNEALRDSLKQILCTIKTPDEYEPYFGFEQNRFHPTAFILNILELMILNNVISLRMLLKLKNKNYNPKQYRLRTERYMTNNNSSSFVIFDFLSMLLGSDLKLQEALEKMLIRCSEFDFVDENLDIYIKPMIVLADYENNKFNKICDYRYINDNLKTEINYTIGHEMSAERYYSAKNEELIHSANCMPIIYSAFKNYLALK